VSTWNPKIWNCGRKRFVGNRQKQVIMNMFPYRRPRGRPYRGVACMLIDGIRVEMMLDLQN
jgi:hypothetical protein